MNTRHAHDTHSHTTSSAPGAKILFLAMSTPPRRRSRRLASASTATIPALYTVAPPVDLTADKRSTVFMSGVHYSSE